MSGRSMQNGSSRVGFVVTAGLELCRVALAKSQPGTLAQSHLEHNLKQRISNVSPRLHQTPCGGILMSHFQLLT